MYETSRWFFASKVRLMLLFKNCSHYYFQFQTPLSVLLSPFLHSPSIGLIECFTSLSVSLSISPSLLLKHSKKKSRNRGGHSDLPSPLTFVTPSCPENTKDAQKMAAPVMQHQTLDVAKPVPSSPQYTHTQLYILYNTYTFSLTHTRTSTHTQSVNRTSDALQTASSCKLRCEHWCQTRVEKPLHKSAAVARWQLNDWVLYPFHQWFFSSRTW